MFVIRKIGEHSYHSADFSVHRPRGYDHYLVLIVHTAAQFYFDGAWQTVAPDTAFVYRPGQAHRYRAAVDYYADSWIWVDLPPTILEADFPFGRPIPLHHTDRYRSLFHLLCNEFYSTSPQREQIIHNLGFALMHMLARETAHAAKPPLYYALIRLRRDIYNRPEREWSMEEIARDVAVSVSYLHRQYRHYFGVTVNQEIIQSRIDSACALLDATEMPVERVAEACGYRNTEHFIRQFKSVVGTTPGRYRKQKNDEK